MTKSQYKSSHWSVEVNYLKYNKLNCMVWFRSNWSVGSRRRSTGFNGAEVSAYRQPGAGQSQQAAAEQE